MSKKEFTKLLYNYYFQASVYFLIFTILFFPYFY